MSEPIDGYDKMTVSEVDDTVQPYADGLSKLGDSEVVDRLELIDLILEYEKENKDRTTARQSITEVRDEIREEADDRGVLTPEEETQVESETDDSEGDDEDGGEEDDDNGDSPDEAAPDDDADSSEDSSGEDETDAPVEEQTFNGHDGSERIVVRNHSRTPAKIAGFSFDAGEVKDLKANDRILKAVRQNDLQVVR